MNGNELIARILREEGVAEMTCFPNNPLIEEVAKLGIRPIMFRHERGAIMAADGYSRMSDGERFGVVATQNAAGAENSLGGIAQASATTCPSSCCPAATRSASARCAPTSPPLRTTAASSNPSRPSTRPSRSPRPCAAPSTPFAVAAADRRRRAHLRRLRPGGPRGPAALRLPGVVPPASLRGRHRGGRDRPPRRRSPHDLAGSGRPHGGRHGGATRARRAPRHPVFTTMEGKSAFDERHPLSLGAGSRATTGPAHAWIVESDTILALGASLTINGYSQLVPAGKTVIHNTNAVDDINKDTAFRHRPRGRCASHHQGAHRRGEGPDRQPGRTSDVAARLAKKMADWMFEWTPLLESDEAPLEHLPRHPRDRPQRRPRELNGDPRRRRPPRLDGAVLHGYLAPQLHRLGQDDAPRIRHPRHDRRQARPPRSLLPQLHGRWRLWHVRPRPRDLRTRRSAHHHRPPQQRGHGHLPRRLPHCPHPSSAFHT